MARVVEQEEASLVSTTKWRKRKVVPPFGWTQVRQEKNGKIVTMWRCGEMQRDIAGTWRRCSYMCRKDRTVNSHDHRFTIDPTGDDGLPPHLRPKDGRNTKCFAEEVTSLVAKWGGEMSISVRALCSETTRRFLVDLMTLVLEYKARNPAQAFVPEAMVPILNEVEMTQRLVEAGESASTEIRRQLRKFRFVNIMIDAATVMNMKVVHTTLSNPFSTLPPLPFRTTTKDENEWRIQDYKSEIETTLTTLEEGIELVPISVCHDRLSAQAEAVRQVILEGTRCPVSHRQLLVDIPCLNHLLNNAFTATTKNDKFMAMIHNIEGFASIIREKQAVEIIGCRCPLPVATRWLYISDTLSFIVRKIEPIDKFLSQRFVRCHPDFPRARKDMTIEQKEVYHNEATVPQLCFDLHAILAPVKFASLCFECEQSRLSDAISIIQTLIAAYRDIVESRRLQYRDSYEFLHEFLSQLFARLETYLPMETWAAWALTREGRVQLREKFQQTTKLIEEDANDYVTPEFAYNDAAVSMKNQIDETFRGIHDAKRYLRELEKQRDDNITVWCSHAELKGERDEDSQDHDSEDEDSDFECTLVPPTNEDEDSSESKESAIPEYCPWSDSQYSYGSYDTPNSQDTRSSQVRKALKQKRQTDLHAMLQTIDVLWSAYEKAQQIIVKYCTALYPGTTAKHAIDLFDQWIYGWKTIPKHEFDAPNDFDMWNNLGKYELTKGLPQVALRLISLATSESDVERLISVHRYIVHERMTRISSKVLLARLRLHAMKLTEAGVTST